MGHFNYKLSYSKGFASIFVLLVVIILGSISLAGGIFPNLENNTTESIESQNLVEDQDSTARNTLQLKALLPKSGREKEVTPPPTISQPVKECKERVAVAFLVDVSGSMSRDNKMKEARSALSAFVNLLADDSVIGIYTFSGGPTVRPPEPRERLPFGYYKDVKTQTEQVIAELRLTAGYTYMRDGFNFVKTKLAEAIPRFSEHQFALIFLSDGAPETKQCHPVDIHLKKINPCWPPKDQDPNTPPSVAQDIKNMGVRIYSIALLDKNVPDEYAKINTEEQRILKEVASPQSYYDTFNPEDLTNIYREIGTTLCQ